MFVKNITKCVILLAVALMTVSVSCVAQQSADQQSSQSVSRTGLLPIYGVDIAIDPSWVDVPAFPSSTTADPNSGTGAVFGQLWDGLKPCGFNSIRFAVDVRKPDAAANQIVNLCLWARSSNMYLLPILRGADANAALPESYAQNAADTVKAFAKLIISNDEKQIYTRVLAFQLEDRMNHAGMHAAMPSDAAAKVLADTASLLRKTEQETLKDSGLDVTPILVNASFDYELVCAKAMAGITLTDQAYATAYSSLKAFLAPITASPEIDLVCVEWYPGSISAGGAEKIPGLLGDLRNDFAGKQILFTTGFSTGFNTPDAQKQYFAAVFANAADFRANDANNSTFLGVFFRQAANGPASPQENSTPSASVDTWDWAAKSEELLNLWQGKATSTDLDWWQTKVDNNMGLFASADDNGATTFTVLPGLDAFLQIAGAVTEANNAVATANADSSGSSSTTTSPDAGASSTQPGSTSTNGGESFVSSLGNAVKGKVQEGLLGLLDKVFQKLGDKITSAGTGTPGGSSGYSAPSSSGYNSLSTAPPTVGVTKVDLAPSAPKVGDQVTCQITLQNQSTSASAWGLTAAVVDNQGYALDNNAQQSGISMDAGASKVVTLSWPASAGKVTANAEVYDSAFNKLASYPVELDVSGSSGESGSTGQVDVKCASGDVNFAPAQPQANAPVKVTVALHNNASQDTPGLDVLLIDKDASPSAALLAEVDGSIVPANGAKSTQLDWTPQEARAHNLSVQVWQGYDTLITETSLPALTVAASSGNSGLGNKFTLPGIGHVPHGGSGRLVSKIPLGLPHVTSLSLGSSETTPMSGKLPMSFSLTNPFNRVLPGVSVTLLMDGVEIGTQSISQLLPKQNRSMEFKGLDLPKPGKHTFQVKLTGGTAKDLQGTVTSEMSITTRKLNTALSSSAHAGSAIAPPAGQPKTRDLLPPTFIIGKQTVLAKPPVLSPVKPVIPGTTTTAPKPRPIIKPTIPGVSASTGATSGSTNHGTLTSKPSIPGISAPVSTGSTGQTTGTAKPGTSASSQTPVIPGISRTTSPGTSATTSTGTKPVVPSNPNQLPTTRPAGTINTTAPSIQPGLTMKPVKPDLSITTADIDYSITRGTMNCRVTIRSLTGVDVKGAQVVCMMTADGAPVRQDFTTDVKANGMAQVKWSCPAPKSKTVKIEAAVTCADDAVLANNRASRMWSMGR